MAWIYLVIAGLFEMTGVLSINLFHKRKDILSIFLMLGTFAGSFLFLALAMKDLPMGTAYAIWTGIGASGGAIIGMVWFGESKDWKRLLFITMVLAAAVGLKLTA
ncbi:DMT family transporter [Bacillus testis]|uniref:DMT family transporter n=1 Tax=Bacillus testis TaxID=1622072 RepID=UPI00067F6489|nr:multidrug efflux SMR transporter [Bacillus testis]